MSLTSYNDDRPSRLFQVALLASRMYHPFYKPAPISTRSAIKRDRNCLHSPPPDFETSRRTCFANSSADFLSFPDNLMEVGEGRAPPGICLLPMAIRQCPGLSHTVCKADPDPDQDQVLGSDRIPGPAFLRRTQILRR